MKAKFDAVKELFDFASQMEVEQAKAWKQKKQAPPQPQGEPVDGQPV